MRFFPFAIFCVFFCAAQLSSAQDVNLEGRVVDSATREPLAFVNVTWGKPSQSCA